jgi:FkbM family methyltransferase
MPRTVFPTQPSPPAPATLPPVPSPAAVPAAQTVRPPPQRAGTPADMARKIEIEAAMLAAPQDADLRNTYFDHLIRIAVANTGLLTANLPELGTPLYFRCGTPDIAVLARVFRDNALAFEMQPTPVRIMVLGAYTGYSTVDLARRFPRAQLVAVEPLPDNFRLLLLNTGAWRRIECANIAVWHHPARLATTLRFQADWGIRLHDEAASEDRTIQAVSMAELLESADWPDVDMVLCDIGGSEREVFANPNADWLIGLDAALVRLHEPVAPNATEWVEAALHPDEFEHRRVGEMELYVRREPRRVLRSTPPELPLLRTDPGVTPFVLADAPAANFGFFVYDGINCQVHPNPPGGKPARALFTLLANGHQRFVSDVLHAGRPSPPIVFTAAVQREDGTLAGRAEVTVKQRKTDRLVIEFNPPLSGTVRVALQTEMAPGAPNANMAWARWLEPKLV